MMNIRKDYFRVDLSPPIYDELDFDRRFRVPRTLFMGINHAMNDLKW